MLLIHIAYSVYIKHSHLIPKTPHIQFRQRQKEKKTTQDEDKKL